MKVVCFGDSNTWGYDPRGFWGDPYEEIWPVLLAQMTGWTVINWGENGREIPSAEIAFPKDMDLLILMLGTNDLLHCGDADRVSQKMERFLQCINVTREKILLISPPHMRSGTWVMDSKLINESAVMTVNFHSLSQKLGIRFADAEAWGITIAYDGVHFSEYGHHAFAWGLTSYLSKELGICWKKE